MIVQLLLAVPLIAGNIFFVTADSGLKYLQGELFA
jgi:hypothetical protein